MGAFAGGVETAISTRRKTLASKLHVQDSNELLLKADNDSHDLFVCRVQSHLL